MGLAESLKAVAATGLAALLFFGGRSCGKASSVETISQKNLALMAASQSLTNAAITLREVDAATKAAKAAEKQAQRKAEEAVRGAADDAKLAEERIKRISDEIRAAGQEPSCRAQLEQTLCVPLH